MIVSFSCSNITLDMYGSRATCNPVNLFFSNKYFFCSCEMEVGMYLFVILEIGKGGLYIHLVRI